MPKAEGRSPQPSTNLAAGAAARERGCEPAYSADEAGSQLTGIGGSNLRYGESLSAVNVPDRIRASSFQPHIGAIARLREKLRVHECTKQCVAHVALQTPQSLSLCGRQSKSRHFYVLTLNPLKHVVDTHEAPEKNAAGPVVSEKFLIATRVPIGFC